MKPQKPLPYDSSFTSPEQYVSSLLDFVTTTNLFQHLCGGVHVVDFFTHEGGLFQHIVPPEWQSFLRMTSSMDLLDLLMREDLDNVSNQKDTRFPLPVPGSLIDYARQIRRHTLRRELAPHAKKLPVLPRQVAVGMKPKKAHEVTNFADYIDRLAGTVDELRNAESGQNGQNRHINNELEAMPRCTVTKITHLVDFGSGQNYLGRTLSSPPYNRHIVAVEGRESNIECAKDLDCLAGLSEREVAMRNKKVWQQYLDSQKPEDELTPKAKRRLEALTVKDANADLRPKRELKTIYKSEPGKGSIQYIAGRLDNGDLTEVIAKLRHEIDDKSKDRLGLMGVSIHSCGNLSHHGIRSLILNPEIKAVAIVGCCYNLATEKLGPPTYKLPFMRPSLQAINGRVVRESERRDPQGFPMSERLSTYNGIGIRLNITARMMACQAPYNWTESESAAFFTRHFYRAVLQKIFLDRGVIQHIYHGPEGGENAPDKSPFNMSTNPLIIGSVRKTCYSSFTAYVRGALAKLMNDKDYEKYSPVVKEKMSNLTNDEIMEYEAKHKGRKGELSAIWSLMAFSASVVESLMVTDRWLFLKEYDHLVKDCWVETVFDYHQSPRNLVIVGIKR